MGNFLHSNYWKINLKLFLYLFLKFEFLFKVIKNDYFKIIKKFD